MRQIRFFEIGAGYESEIEALPQIQRNAQGEKDVINGGSGKAAASLKFFYQNKNGRDEYKNKMQLLGALEKCYFRWIYSSGSWEFRIYFEVLHSFTC